MEEIILVQQEENAIRIRNDIVPKSIPKVGKGNHWQFLALLTSLQALFSCVITSTSVLSAFIIDDLGVTKARIGFAGGAANVGQALSSIIFGRLVDKKSGQQLVLFCIIAAGLCIILASQTKSFISFTFFLVFTGFWCSISTPFGGKAIMQWFPQRHIGLAISVRQTGVPLGALLGSTLLIFLAINFGWRIAMLSAGMLLISGGVVYYFFYRGLEKKSVSAVTEGKKEHTKESGAIPRKSWSFIRDIDYWRVLLAGMMFMGLQYVLVTYLPLFMLETCDYPIAMASLCLAISQGGGIGTRLVLGLVSDRLLRGKYSTLLIFEASLMLVVFVVLMFWQKDAPLWQSGFVSLFFGISAMGWNGVHVALVIKIATKEQSGAALGILVAVLQVGVLIIPPIFGYIVDITHSYRGAFLMCIICVCIALVLLLRTHEPA